MLSFTAKWLLVAMLVARGGFEPPASALSGRRSKPAELPDRCLVVVPRTGLEPAPPL